MIPEWLFIVVGLVAGGLLYYLKKEEEKHF